MHNDTQSVRDRLLAALRDTTEPLTTHEVCEAAGGYLVSRPCGQYDGDHRVGNTSRWYRLLQCDGTTHIVWHHLNVFQRGYVTLRALEQAGLVTRHRIPGKRDVRWSRADTNPDTELAALEALWSKEADR